MLDGELAENQMVITGEAAPGAAAPRLTGFRLL
jgi:hypothetical protein